jgi:tetratricopeptide (TPR) repeat protein
MSTESRLAGLSPEIVRRVQAAAQALERGQVDDAEREILAANAERPAHAEILRLIGMTQILRGRASAAIPVLLQADGLRPGDALIQLALGNAFTGVRDHANALAALRRACELAPQLAAAWFNLGRFLYGNGQVEEAAQPLRRTLELSPRYPHARTMLASVLGLDGRVADAEAEYRRILADEPTCGAAWWGLAALTPMPLDAADVARMQALPVDGIGADDRIALGYALAHALERQGDYAGAFAALRDANARARLRKPWSADAFKAQLDDILAAFPAAAPASFAQGEEVIFIVSLPRSGSTLIEQILASHSQVEGTSELADLPQVVAEESRRLRQPFAQWARTHSAEQWQQLGQRYLQRTLHLRAHRPRHTDKMPGNWLYVGAIARMLPQARIVVVWRDPLETCLGCYRYLFEGHPYTHDFSDLATAWHGFDRASSHWQALHPQQVREQSYERLTADAEAQIRELLDFCGLPFEPACLDFSTTQRRVVTASAGQVREPLRRATARADQYGALLDPLRVALGLPIKD